MYDLVYAVNQQYPEKGSPGGLLILTKFAELVADSNNPRLRISNKRIQAMTRMSERTVDKHLKELKAANFLVPLEDKNAKHTGNLPTLYELRLPEGFNREEVMKRHLMKYYGGKYFAQSHIDATYLELGDKEGNGKMLPPVSAEVVAYTEASEIDKPMSEIDKKASKFDKEVSKIDPYNNIKNIKSNNNKPNVSADAVDDDFLKKYCEDTNLSPKLFKKHGITSENVHLLEKCITFWNDAIENSGKTIKNPTGFLVNIIKDTVTKGKFDDKRWISKHEPKAPTFDEVQQKLRKEQERVAEQNKNYKYPKEVISAAQKITQTALDKFNIKVNENNIRDLLNRYLNAKPKLATKVADDFEKNCNLVNKTEEGVTDWLRNSILCAIGINN